MFGGGRVGKVWKFPEEASRQAEALSEQKAVSTDFSVSLSFEVHTYAERSRRQQKNESVPSPVPSSATLVQIKTFTENCAIKGPSVGCKKNYDGHMAKIIFFRNKTFLFHKIEICSINNFMKPHKI
jgi:hypothetical protein